MMTKKCSKCNLVKSLNSFYSVKGVIDCRASSCKDCSKLYFQSEKGKQAKKRYFQSEKGKQAKKRYFQSEKGKQAKKRYDQSEKGKQTRERYFQSEKFKIDRDIRLSSRGYVICSRGEKHQAFFNKKSLGLYRTHQACEQVIAKHRKREVMRRIEDEKLLIDNYYETL